MHYLKGACHPIPTGHVTITDAASLAAAIPRTGLCNGTGCVLDAKGKCTLKANSPGYCTATLVAPLRRKENTESNEWLGLDIDSPDLPEGIEGYERVVVQTHSGHWHVHLRAERPMTPAEYGATIKPWLAKEKKGKGADGNAKDVCRFWFAPAAGSNVTAYEGARLPVLSPAVGTLQVRAVGKAKPLPWTDEALRALLLDDTADTNDKAGQLGAALGFRFWTEDATRVYAQRMLGLESRHIGSVMSAWKRVADGEMPLWDGAKQLAKDYGLEMAVPEGGPLERLTLLLEIQYDLAWNEMALRIENGGKPWKDTDTTAARRLCEKRGLKRVPRGDVDDAILELAEANSYHPVKRYLGGLQWDGRARLDLLWVRYFGVDDTPLNRALGACFGIGAVKRVLEPGTKVDMMPILFGPQGRLKSTGLRALAGDAFFSDAAPNFAHRAENAMTLRKAWIWEVPELEGMNRGELNAVKAFVTRSEDDVLLPYAKAKTSMLRTGVLAGTTNEEHCLRDTTGNRRYPVLTIGKIDIPALRRDRDMLWAEAKARALAGEQHWLRDDMTETLQTRNEEHLDLNDGIVAVAMAWAANPPRGRISFGVNDFLSEGCHVPLTGQNHKLRCEAGAALRLAGFEAKRGPKPRKLTIYTFPEQPGAAKAEGG